ncbi:MAG TPA: methylated-DNA--[protein]-cysteine S-methyltransferase [Gammaproteobacteria bacterium]|nr:methylated-DNA--[protein]-cysteine S-methyltransferase [Gammaproteobacteria bacterium]
MNIEQYTYYESPIGRILLAGTNDTLLLLSLPEGKMQREPQGTWHYNPNAFSDCKAQLNEYFAGKRKVFNVNYVLQGTEFQQLVLKRVAAIPYGQTASYSDIAQQIEQPKAVRAIGGANATNPLPIIIPCHRVIGKNGALTGFGGGLQTKGYLLNLEAALPSSYNG